MTKEELNMKNKVLIMTLLIVLILPVSTLAYGDSFLENDYNNEDNFLKKLEKETNPFFEELEKKDHLNGDYNPFESRQVMKQVVPVKVENSHGFYQIKSMRIYIIYTNNFLESKANKEVVIPLSNDLAIKYSDFEEFKNVANEATIINLDKILKAGKIIYIGSN
jgi:hypothetical protein